MSEFFYNFSPNDPPKFYHEEPKKFIISNFVTKLRVPYKEYTPLMIAAFQYSFMEVEVNLEHDGYDSGSYEIVLLFGEADWVHNPNYNKELRDYNELRELHEEKLKEWNETKLRWQAAMAKKKESADRELYLKLKAQFEPTANAV